MVINNVSLGQSPYMCVTVALKDWMIYLDYTDTYFNNIQLLPMSWSFYFMGLM